MNNTAMVQTERQQRDGGKPGHIVHESFHDKRAAEVYDPSGAEQSADFELRHMPDEVTRDHAKRMHYAAHRWHTAKRPAEARKWQARYFDMRDRIVLGNRKLVYKAVRRRMTMVDRSDDLIGECHLVLIQAVAAFNPWMGIRFSTYAYTCLIRALSRMSQRMANDWFARSMPLDFIAEGGPSENEPDPSSTGDPRLDEFFRDDNPLLSDREKAILNRRFRSGDSDGPRTLERVGRELGLSKERVRQVQTVAIEKLRRAMAGA